MTSRALVKRSRCVGGKRVGRMRRKMECKAGPATRISWAWKVWRECGKKGVECGEGKEEREAWRDQPHWVAGPWWVGVG